MHACATQLGKGHELGRHYIQEARLDGCVDGLVHTSEIKAPL